MRPDSRKGRLAVTTAFVAFVLGLTGAAMADQPATLDDALALAAQENQVLVVDFYTDW